MRMRWRDAMLLGAALAALGACAAPMPLRPDERRIVSVDYCADQMVLGLVPIRDVAAVSLEADADPQFSARLARGKPRVRPDVERILALRPTLVVRSYAGGPRLESALRRAGVRVFTLPYADSLATVTTGILASGEALDSQADALNQIARLDAIVRTTRASLPSSRTALYLTPGNVTTGPDTLIGEIMALAGLRTVERRPGWHRLDIEGLLTTPPQVVVRGFMDSHRHQQDRWSSATHSALRRAIEQSATLELPGSSIACGNGRIADALERLANLDTHPS
jgi:iron complex transport system substrate-binding protein